MARIRTIKPEFFTSEDIVSLSPMARLLYIALWCEADREGRLNWKPRTLRMKYLPAESCDVMPICNELVSANLVVPYIADEEPYAVLPSFKKHQAINVREAQSSIPAPPDGVHVHARAKDAWAVDADTRVTVLARDAHKCVRCGSNEHLQIDHIFPKSMGGTNAITNLRVLCRSCNAGRPVSGQGLIDDLAQDGLTLGDMQRTCMHVQGNGEGKGREGKGKEIYARPSDVSEQVWKDYKQLRKDKKATVSKTVVDGVREEAGKLGMTLEDALQLQVTRGWQGFDASWVSGKQTQSSAIFAGAI